jgi:hypothetical protein
MMNGFHQFNSVACMWNFLIFYMVRNKTNPHGILGQWVWLRIRVNSSYAISLRAFWTEVGFSRQPVACAI